MAGQRRSGTPRPRFPIISPNFNSYDNFLKEKGLPLNTIPTPAEPLLTDEYRKWRTREQTLWSKDPNHEDIVSGRHPIYGLHPKYPRRELLPIFGPPTLNQMYPEPKDFGPEYEVRFHESQRMQNYLAHSGYAIVDNITLGNPTEFDNQIWRVRSKANNQIMVCKVVSFRHHYERIMFTTATKALAKMEKESQVLQTINHENIIKVIDVIRIRDRVTDFEQVFLASIMEMMENSIDKKWRDYEKPGQLFAYPEALVIDMTIQLISAVNHIHNEIPAFVCVHQAIRTANILYRHIGVGQRLLFKLTDFEECFTFDKSKRVEGKPIDIVENYFQYPIVYPSYTSAPEVLSATSYKDLRLMPNDVWCLATCACILLSGADYRNQSLYRSYMDKLHKGQIEIAPDVINYFPQFLAILRLMTNQNCEQRITAQQLMNNNQITLLRHVVQAAQAVL